MNITNINLLQGLSRYRSQLMGISILWIMLFHSGIEVPDNIVLRALWYLFVSFGGGCGVDIFFMLSGFGLVYSASKLTNKKQWINWNLKRIVRIIPSYLIVGLLWYLIKGDCTLYNLCQFNFLVDGIRDFWFISGIIICYLLFPLLFEAGRKIGLRTVCIISVLAVFCAVRLS